MTQPSPAAETPVAPVRSTSGALTKAASAGEMPGHPSGDSVSTWCVLLVALLAVVVMFFNLGGYRTLASHEAYAMVPAREMLDSGDWIVPRFGGIPRLKKPPLVYWTIATTATLCGELNELTGRLHSAFAALALSLLVGCFATRWWGPRAGLAAGLIQATSVYVLMFARRAEVDMLLCLLTTSALLLVSSHRPEESRGRSFARFTAVWALTATAWMAKFHYGPVMVMAPTVAWFVLRQWWTSLLRLLNPLGLALMAAAVFIWPALLLQRAPEAAAVWERELLGRAVGDMGYRPVWFYVPHLLWLPLPWTPLAIAAIPASWRRAWRGWPSPLALFQLLAFGNAAAVATREDSPNSRTPIAVPSRTPPLTWSGRLTVLRDRWNAASATGDCREQFLWLWLLIPLVIVTVQAQKHKHYLMAALPVVTLLAAQVQARIWARLKSNQPLLPPFHARAVCLSLAAGAVVLAGYVVIRWPSIALATGIACGTLAGGGCLAVWLLQRQRVTAGMVSIGCVFACCYTIAMGWMIPQRDHRRPMTAFAERTRELASPQQPVRVFALGMHPVVYYLGNPVQRVEESEILRQEVQRQGRLQVVLHRERLPELTGTSLTGPPVTARIVEETHPDPRLSRLPEDLVLVELQTAPSTDDSPAPATLQQATQTPAAPHTTHR